MAGKSSPVVFCNLQGDVRGDGFTFLALEDQLRKSRRLRGNTAAS